MSESHNLSRAFSLVHGHLFKKIHGPVPNFHGHHFWNCHGHCGKSHGHFQQKSHICLGLWQKTARESLKVDVTFLNMVMGKLSFSRAKFGVFCHGHYWQVTGTFPLLLRAFKKFHEKKTLLGAPVEVQRSEGPQELVPGIDGPRIILKRSVMIPRVLPRVPVAPAGALSI